jgi:hypothetical protein
VTSNRKCAVLVEPAIQTSESEPSFARRTVMPFARVSPIGKLIVDVVGLSVTAGPRVA